MIPVSRSRGPSRDLVAGPLFDSRHREDAGAIEVQKRMIGRDVLQVA